MRAPQKVSDESQHRISQKIEHLVNSHEVPNTPAGRKKAAGMAFGMSRAGRLGPKGGYKRA